MDVGDWRVCGWLDSALVHLLDGLFVGLAISADRCGYEWNGWNNALKLQLLDCLHIYTSGYFATRFCCERRYNEYVPQHTRAIMLPRAAKADSLGVE